MSTHSDQKNSSLSLVLFIALVVGIVLPIRMFIAKPFIVQGTSMYPTFNSWHYLIIDEISYRFHEPLRGDVIVMRYPLDTGKYFIKRIVGLPGEEVILDGLKVTIKNSEYPEGLTLSEAYVNPETRNENHMRITLTNDQYFVMGDNRDASSDSRYWGPLPKDDIIGRAYVRLFPFTRIDYLPGSLANFTE